MEHEESEIKAAIEKIRQEEVIRTAIQKELAVSEQKSNSNRIWELLNSKFGLWLLSTIFITGVGSLYTNYQNKIKEQQQIAEVNRKNEKLTNERIDRLSMEFSYRLSTSLILLEYANSLSSKEIDFNKTKNQALAPLKDISSGENRALYPEFKDSSGLALIAELSTIVKAGERAELKDIITKISGVLNVKSSPDKMKKLNFMSLAGELLESTEQWQYESGFRYLDCKKEKPFC